MYDIVSLGELLVDFTESGLSPAGMRLFEQNAGGAVTNLVCAASRCGAKTAFIGKVGNDMHGHFLKQAMIDAGVDMHALVEADDVFTTLAFVALAKSGEREFSFARKPGADTCLRSDELDMEMLKNTRIFHTGSLSLTAEPARAATYEAIDVAKAAGAIISYDPNYRASLWQSREQALTYMRSLACSADIIKISDEELPLITCETDPDKAADALIDIGVRVVAVTLGGEGAYVRVGSEGRAVPGFAAKAVDTTGAGDAFFGGFLYRFLSTGRTLKNVTADDAADCARFGNATASLCVEHRGGIPAMPKLEAVLKRMNG
ncbi:MAG TPA: carbohydrate kinase [Eubacteriales bacterium]|nr:carbohydrate kinase [Eubacteriales bacterium]